MNDEDICISKFYSTELSAFGNRTYSQLGGNYHQSCKQCLCSHKDSKQTSGVTAGSLFLLVGGTAPKPLFAEFHSAAAHRSGAFSFRPRRRFLKPARLAYQHNRKLPRKGNRHFFKNPSGSQSRSQRETLFKWFGMLPNKQNLRFPASPGTSGFERLYIQTPCLPSSAWLLFSLALDKIFSKALTGTSVCATIMGN